jgi:hypothetical protein
MPKKVLGFREKDVKRICILEGLNHTRHEYEYTFHESKLVPIVSLEWLEKYCKEKQFTDWEGKCSCGKEFTISHPKELAYLEVSDLLLVAKKEAKK